VDPHPLVPDLQQPRRGSIASILARREGGVFVASPAGIHVFDRERWRLLPTTDTPVSIAQSGAGVLWMTEAIRLVVERWLRS